MLDMVGAGGRVVIRYQIGNDGAAVSPKGASGGLISTYNGNVIHTFLESGTFNVPHHSGNYYLCIGR